MICVFTNNKGGCGKTTCITNISKFLAIDKSQPTIIVDIDPQSQVGQVWNISGSKLKVTVTDVLENVDQLSNAINSVTNNLDILPSADNTKRVAISEATKKNVNELINRLTKKYQNILIDTNGLMHDLNKMFIDNADLVVIPFMPDNKNITGVNQIIATFPKSKFLLIPFGFNLRTKNDTQILKLFQDSLKSLSNVKFANAISNSVKPRQAENTGCGPLSFGNSKCKNVEEFEQVAETMFKLGNNK